VDKLRLVLEQLSTLEDPHIQFVLLCSFLGLPKFMYCLRTTDPAIATHIYSKFDDAQCTAVASCVGDAFTTADPQ
jgi:hypothetical protein